MKHFLPQRRLQWEYARRLAYCSAYATPERDALVYACKPPTLRVVAAPAMAARNLGLQVGAALARMLRAPAGLAKRSLGRGTEGDTDVLQAEFLCGRLDGLLAARPWYARGSWEVRAVMKRLAQGDRGQVS
jgi:hypothetical protein